MIIRHGYIHKDSSFPMICYRKPDGTYVMVHCVSDGPCGCIWKHCESVGEVRDYMGDRMSSNKLLPDFEITIPSRNPTIGDFFLSR